MTVGTLNRIRRYPKRFQHSLHSRVKGVPVKSYPQADDVDLTVDDTAPNTKSASYTIEFIIYIDGVQADYVESSPIVISVSTTDAATAIASDLDALTGVSASATTNVVTVTGTGLTDIGMNLNY